MEFKNVEKELNKDYPKKEDIGEKELKRSIPKKWKIIGVSTLALALIGGGVIGGISVLRSAQGMFPTTLSEAYVNEYNKKFDYYVGINKSAQEVRTLLDAINSNNKQQIYSEDQRMIQVNYTSPNQETITLFGTWNFKNKGKFGEDGVELKEFDTKGGTVSDLPTTAEFSAKYVYKVTGYKSSEGVYYGFDIVAVEQ